MTMGREWQDTSGHSLHSRSCEELGRVYTLLAERLLQKQDCELAIKMLTKAYDMAKECTVCIPTQGQLLTDLKQVQF